MIQCVFEFAIEPVSAAGPDDDAQSNLDSECAGRSRRPPHFFAIWVDGAAFP